MLPIPQWLKCVLKVMIQDSPEHWNMHEWHSLFCRWKRQGRMVPAPAPSNAHTGSGCSRTQWSPTSFFLLQGLHCGSSQLVHWFPHQFQGVSLSLEFTVLWAQLWKGGGAYGGIYSLSRYLLALRFQSQLNAKRDETEGTPYLGPHP